VTVRPQPLLLVDLHRAWNGQTRNPAHIKHCWAGRVKDLFASGPRGWRRHRPRVHFDGFPAAGWPGWEATRQVN